MTPGKTATIWKRQLKVYLPSEQDVEKWNRRAKTEGKSLSRFLVECAERGWEPRIATRDQERLEEQDHEIRRLKEQLEVVRERHMWDVRLLKMQEEKLKLARASSGASRPGRHPFSTELLRILQERPALQDRDIYRELHVRAKSPEAAMLRQQLELLEQAGALERTGNGWRWLVPKRAPLIG